MLLNPQSLDTSMGTPKSPTSKKNNLLDISGVHDRRKSFVFNETTLDKGLHHWEEYKVQGKKISRRSYHSSVFYKQAMYVYGGYELNQGILQDFVSVNLEGDLPYLQWDDVDASKELTPGPLCRHSAVVYKDNMFVYGGQVASLKNTNQFIAYDFLTQTWSEIQPTNPEFSVPLDSHSAILWQKDAENASMIVVGGFIGGNVGDYSNAVLEYNFEQNTWNTLFKNKLIESEKQSQKLGVPQARVGMGACINQNNLYIFAGNEGNTKFNDLWKFDLINKTWSCIKPTGNLIPEPRNGLTMVSYKDMLIVFGGILDITNEKNDIFVYNITSNKWENAEQATKWVFQQEEKQIKPSPLKKSTFGKKEPRNKSLQKSSHAHHHSHPNIRLAIQKADSDYGSQYSDQSQDISFAENQTTLKAVRFEKLQLPSVYQNSVSQSKIGREAEELGRSASHRTFKSTMAENHLKSKMMKKMLLLNEFQVSETEAQTLRAPTPATDSLIKSLKNLTISPANVDKIDYSVTTRDILLTSKSATEEKIKVGVKPVGRDGHSAVVVKDRMFIFAGDRHKMSFNDLFALNLSYFGKN